MVDKVYVEDLPRLRRALEELKQGFSELSGYKTDWVSLRIDPLLNHAAALERLMSSGEFSQEFSRLRRGVALFHSDLVYLRENVKNLKEILRSESKSRRYPPKGAQRAL